MCCPHIVHLSADPGTAGTSTPQEKRVSMRLKSTSRYALLLGLIMAVTGSVGPALAAPPPQPDDNELVLYAPTTRQTLTIEEPDQQSSPQKDDDMFTPMLLGPIDSLNCNVLNRPSHIVTTYNARARSGFSGGYIKMECGTDAGYGYRHIRSRHQQDWQNKMYPLRANWDDFMDFATKQALASPSKTAFQGSGKYCYTTPVQIRNSRGAVVKTFYPRIIISSTNRRVITSIPGGSC